MDIILQRKICSLEIVYKHRQNVYWLTYAREQGCTEESVKAKSERREIK
jgi:hypothetical protein